AAFDARGRRLAWLDTDRSGALIVELALPAAAHRTLYARLGDVVPLACLLIVAGLGVGTLAEKTVKAG
ncbi:hypothetical protein, partial [Actinocorallia lasiicapitis]